GVHLFNAWFCWWIIHMVWRSVGDCTTTVSGIILRRYARAAVIRLTTMPGMDSHAVCAALQRHKSPIRDPVRRDLGARAATEESCTRLFSCVSVSTVHAHPGLNERADQPRPDCPLVINSISRPRVALVVLRVSAFARCE